MTLQEKIKQDLVNAIKTKSDRLTDLRVILGEIQRAPTKNLPDDEVIKILKRLEKTTMEMGNDEEFLQMLRSYIPEMVGAEEIRAWIEENIDFLQLKNKLQAVGITKKYFGETAVGQLIKDIVMEME